jgi:hypothetical protein
MAKKRIVVGKMPDWLRVVADDSSIRIGDFAAALGISTRALDMRVRRGQAPPADWKSIHGTTRRQWRGATVRKFFSEQQARHNGSHQNN